MSRWWHYVLVGLVAWLVFLIWRLPASVAYSFVNESSNLPVKLSGLQGTLWQGQAAQVVYQKQSLGSANWELSPWSLLLTSLSGEIQLNQGDGYLKSGIQRAVTGGETEFSAVEARIPLATIQPHLKNVPVPLEGSLSVKLNSLAVGESGNIDQADGRIVWHQAGVSAPQQLALGDLQMNLKANAEGEIEGIISDSGGPLKLLASLILSKSGDYQLSGQLKGSETAPKELTQSLSLLGKQDSQGFYSFSFSGKL